VSVAARLGSPPPAGIVYGNRWPDVIRSDRNTNREPSGDHAGSTSANAPSVSGTGSSSDPVSST
jgi:hypothetical protein